MKPIILIERNGKVILSKEDLQNIITDVYEEGKKDGRNSASNPNYWYVHPYRWYDETWKVIPSWAPNTISTASNPKNIHTHTTAVESNNDPTTATVTTWTWDPRTITFKAVLDEENENE